MELEFVTAAEKMKIFDVRLSTAPSVWRRRGWSRRASRTARCCYTGWACARRGTCRRYSTSRVDKEAVAMLRRWISEMKK